MPRTARKRSESGYYHIILRGINKQNLFYDNEDREVFVNRIKIAKEISEYKIIVFYLMTNHVHLLIQVCYLKNGFVATGYVKSEEV